MGKFEDEVLGGILVQLVVIATSSFALVFHGRGRENREERDHLQVSSDYFAIDRVYFDDWVDFMGNVYPTTSR